MASLIPADVLAQIQAAVKDQPVVLIHLEVNGQNIPIEFWATQPLTAVAIVNRVIGNEMEVEPIKQADAVLEFLRSMATPAGAETIDMMLSTGLVHGGNLAALMTKLVEMTAARPTMPSPSSVGGSPTVGQTSTDTLPLPVLTPTI